MSDIPKIIHYCWFGGKPLPPLAKKCIASWKKYCPDWDIKEWNESNAPIDEYSYIKEALSNKKYAFATDVVRLIILKMYGGLYLDTDVELIKSIDDLCDCDGFMGFEHSKNGINLIATGLGIATISEHPIIINLLADYQDIHFVREDGSFDTTPCTERNTKVLINHGLRPDNSFQIIEGIKMLPAEYLCPINYYTNEFKKTKNTYTIHHYAMSWMTTKEKNRRRYLRFIAKVKKNSLGGFIIKLKKKIFPNQIQI